MEYHGKPMVVYKQKGEKMWVKKVTSVVTQRTDCRITQEWKREDQLEGYSISSGEI